MEGMAFVAGFFGVAVGLVMLRLAEGLASGYGGKKGANLATVQDIDRVTRRLEAVQAEFSSAVQKAVAAHGHLFQLEVSIYRELWDAYLELEKAASTVWYDGVARNASAAAYREFGNKVGELRDHIRRLSPFFPQEMHVPLLKAQLPIRLVAVELADKDYSRTEEIKTYLDENLPRVWDALSELESAIRGRLWAWEAALQRLVGAGEAGAPGRPL